MILSLDGLESPHSISFACACLPVHEQRSMVTFKDIVEQRLASLLKYLVLRCALIEYAIIIELIYFIFEIQCHSMVYELKAALGELIPKRSVSYEYFYLILPSFLIHQLWFVVSAHIMLLVTYNLFTTITLHNQCEHIIIIVAVH